MFEHSFIDWISIREKHNGRFKPVNGGRVIRIDQNGEQVYDCPVSTTIEGSHSSSARVRITENLVEISFNPSRWNRPENVFGLNYEGAIAKANELLASIGQPALRPGRKYFQQSGTGKVKYLYIGAEVTRIDITTNFETGSEKNLSAYMRHLYRLKLPQVETRRKGQTVYYGKSTKRKILKVYPKHQELMWRSHESTDEKAVLKIAEHCQEVGMARIELRIGRDYLRESGLRASGEITHRRLVEIMKKESAEVRKELESVDVTHLSRSELGTLMIWMNGYDVKGMMSQASWYKHRKSILKYTGYDIAHELTRIQPEPNRIVLKAAVPPDWYGMPVVNQRTLKSVD